MVLPTSTLTNPVKPFVALTADEESRLVAHWQDILTGRTEPEHLTIPTEVEAVVKAEEVNLPWTLTSAEQRRLREDHALSFFHGGQPVVCLETPSGRAVLAFGEDQVSLFQARLPLECQRRVRLHYPPIW